MSQHFFIFGIQQLSFSFLIYSTNEYILDLSCIPMRKSLLILITHFLEFKFPNIILFLYIYNLFFFFFIFISSNYNQAKLS